MFDNENENIDENKENEQTSLWNSININWEFLWKKLEEEITIEDLNLEEEWLDKIIFETVNVLWKFLNINITKIMFKEVIDKWIEKIWLVILENEENKNIELKFVDSIFEDDDYWVTQDWKFIFFTN